MCWTAAPEETARLVVQLILLAVVFVIAASGNGCILASVAYFKSLRTVPNILIVNLAVVDLLNSLANMPIFAAFWILECSAFRGRTLSYFVISLHNLLVYNNLLSLVLLMFDRYAAIAHGLWYRAWKTAKRAYRAVAFTWLGSVVIGTGMALYRHTLLANYDAHLTTKEYRRLLYRSGGGTVAFAVFAAPFVTICIVGVLLYRSVWKRARKMKELARAGGYSTHMREALKRGRRQETRAGQTVCLVIAVYAVCCFPAILHSALMKKGVDTEWSEFCAYFFVHMTSACNPVVYAFRGKHFRKVLVDLFRRRARRSEYVPTPDQLATGARPKRAESSEPKRSLVPPTDSTDAARRPEYAPTPLQLATGARRKRADSTDAARAQIQAPTLQKTRTKPIQKTNSQASGAMEAANYRIEDEIAELSAPFEGAIQKPRPRTRTPRARLSRVNSLGRVKPSNQADIEPEAVWGRMRVVIAWCGRSNSFTFPVNSVRVQTNDGFEH